MHELSYICSFLSFPLSSRHSLTCWAWDMRVVFFLELKVYILWPLKTSLTWRKIPDWMMKMSCLSSKYDDQQIAMGAVRRFQIPRIWAVTRIWLATGWDALSGERWSQPGIPGNMSTERESRSSDEESWESAETLLTINTRSVITQRGKNADHENRLQTFI